MINFSQLEKIMDGQYLLVSSDSPITTLSIDSRKAKPAEGTLFFAIKGDRNDGHAHIAELYESGVRQFVVEKAIVLDSLHNANVILVHSCIGALQKLATFYRAKFSLPVIGITGSNGKTITKEWLYQMLSKHLIVVKNPGSYNSQVGAPLSIWQLQHHHQLGIFEAGISKPGEMEKLKKVIQPTIGIFTNIGSAHDEGFSSQQEKINEKLKLFKDSEVVVYCKDHGPLDFALSQSGLKTFSWGFSAFADVQISYQRNDCIINYNKETFRLILPFEDPASQENCLHCVTVMLKLGYSMSRIQQGINGLRSIPMRMELKESINQCQVIDDSYNNDLGGLEIALQFLTHQHQKKKKTSDTFRHSRIRVSRGGPREENCITGATAQRLAFHWYRDSAF